MRGREGEREKRRKEEEGEKGRERKNESKTPQSVARKTPIRPIGFNRGTRRKEKPTEEKIILDLPCEGHKKYGSVIPSHCVEQCGDHGVLPCKEIGRAHV